MAYFRWAMPKRADTKRVEIHLLPKVKEELQRIADSEKRSLKNLIEIVLENYLKDNKVKKPKEKPRQE